MQRFSVAGTIYGYLICLVAVLLFIHSAAGFVNSAFGVSGAHGMAGPQMRIMRFHFRPGAMPSPPAGPAAQQAAPFSPPMVRPHAHGPSVRGLVLNFVLILIAAALFGWHWRWLQRSQT